MWGDGGGERAPSSLIKGNRQQLTIIAEKLPAPIFYVVGDVWVAPNQIPWRQEEKGVRFVVLHNNSKFRLEQEDLIYLVFLRQFNFYVT
jgi:hypothetical protein